METMIFYLFPMIGINCPYYNAYQAKAGGDYISLTEERTSGLCFLDDCKAGVMGDGQ